MAVPEIIFGILFFLYIHLKSRRVLSIFSRECESSYHLLLQRLRSERFFTDVKPFTIRNNGWREFREEVSRCNYAILYHSKNRGRVNITDVTDSLYDEELTCLSQQLGKENVFVVVDDLDSSAEKDKQMILHNQPLIRDKAKDLILFSQNRKREEMEKNIKILQLGIMGKGVMGTLLLLEQSAVTLLTSIKTTLLRGLTDTVTGLVSIPATIIQAIKDVTSIPATIIQAIKSAVLFIPTTLLGILGIIPRKIHQN